MKKFSKIIPFPLILIVLTSLILPSCGLKAEADDARKTVDEFYKNMKAKDYDALIEMVDDEGFVANTKEEWRSVFQQKEAIGDLKEYEAETGWHTSINNGVTKVQVDYVTHYTDFDNVYERFVLVKKEDQFKILSYQYNESKSELQNILK